MKQKKSGRFHILQRQILRRRLWLMAAVIFYMIMYYPVAIVMLIARSDENASLQAMTVAATRSQRLSEVSTWIGLRQNFLWVIVIIGVVLAIQGFAYLFNMDKLDFYESQPVSRMERFRSIYINGFLLFEIPLVICLFLAIGCATLMSGMSNATLADAMLELVRVTIIFLASYNVGILAVMLTGNLIMAGLMSGFLLLIDQILMSLIKTLAGTFFRTWTYLGSNSPAFLFSPLYNCLVIQRWMSSQSNWFYSPTTRSLLGKLVQASWKTDAATIAVGIIVLLIAVRLYRNRKAESAGATVLHRPVRAVVRIVTSVAVGLFAGNLIINLFGSTTSRTGTVFMLIGIIVATVLAAGVIEIIYELDIWRFFGLFAEMALAAVAAAFIFVLFRYDLIGYDCYVPAASKVESAALYVYNDSSYDYYSDDSQNTSSQQTVLQTMKLTDIETLEKITAPAMEAMRTVNDENGSTDGWSAVVCYNLKSGRKVYRSILIPYDTDASALDAVVSSKEYREALIPIYHDDYVAENSEQYGDLYVLNGLSQTRLNRTLYQEFAKAYRKDLESSYSYTQMSTEQCLGKVIYRSTQPTYIDVEYEVYPSYTNTLQFLQEHGIDLTKVSYDNVTAVSVYEYTEDDTLQASYSDPEQIREILDSCNIVMSSNWKRSDEVDYSTDISLTYASSQNMSYYGVYFRTGEMPEFVEKDLEDSVEESD